MRNYREEGIDGFTQARPRKTRNKRRAGHVMTAQILEEAQSLLNCELSRSNVADQLGVPRATLRKAISDGRLKEKDAEGFSESSEKSERSLQDAQAAQGLGTACTRQGERVLAAVGALNGVATKFEHCRSVPYGGVLCALGALLANGLLGPSKSLLGEIKGYYTSAHILLLLAFMALCRIKTVEQLRGKAPGELGKLMGLDRVPEVRCLRAKLDDLSHDGAAQKWMDALSRQWMDAEPEAVGTLYVDGHVRVYHGSQCALPRKYVSRQRLCLRATNDYWVNDRSGRPFFVIDKVVDPGLVKVLCEDIVPRLLKDVPNQPTEKELAANPSRWRFHLVFDREGYSPELFKKLWQDHRVACTTYNKYAREDWPESEFTEESLSLFGGQSVTMKLAERGSLIGQGKKAIWVKEIRKLTSKGHQVGIVSTAYDMNPPETGERLFSRWCQENFFRYMMEHFAIDLLTTYQTELLHDTIMVINPLWRKRQRQRNSLESKLRYRRARFAEWSLHLISASEPEKYRKREEQKAELLEEIEHLEAQLQETKAAAKEINKNIPYKDLPEQDRFSQPLLGRKRLMDAVHMIAYRAETAMASLLTTASTDTAGARRILQDLFQTEADLVPDPKEGKLHIHVHRSARPAVDRALLDLFSKLNEMQFVFPGTALTLHYRLLGEEAPSATQNSVIDNSSGKES